MQAGGADPVGRPGIAWRDDERPRAVGIRHVGDLFLLMIASVEGGNATRARTPSRARACAVVPVAMQT